MKKILTLFSVALLFSACGGNGNTSSFSSNTSGKVPSTGGAREIVAVIDNDLYNDSIKKVLREELSPIQYGLPQEETETKLYVITATNFNNMYQNHHSLIFVQKADSTSAINISKNVYSAPQNLVRLKVKDHTDLRTLLDKKSEDILTLFHNSDIKSLQEKSARIAHTKLKGIEAMGVKLTVPNYFRPVTVDSNFVWLLKDIKKGKHLGTVNILVYKYQNTDADNIDPLSLRDTITKKYVQGQMADSYMQIEKSVYYPMSEEIDLNGFFAIETRGLWRTEGDFMGGPFINYTIYDDQTNTIYGVDGFVYFPTQEKAHYIFELESILKTFSLIGR
ncbi:MAG: DUF4837 family protein [Flavobacteriales bacterium]|nr:DUF4837 family protein [Flavobacteriales bacterium]